MMSLRTEVLMREVLMRAGKLSLSAIALAIALSGGCGSGAQPPPDPLAPGAHSTVRMTAQPMTLPGRRISALLDFDSPDDLTFVVSEPGAVLTSDARLARSGRRSLLIPPGTREITIKLPSLLSGRSFPADWTLAGAFLYCDRSTVVTLSYELGGRAVLSRSLSVGAGAWTPVMIDLAALGASDVSEVGILRLAFDTRSMSTVRLDDVTLVDNHEAVVDTSRSPDG